MVKIIVADRKYDCSHLLGEFLDESHYDILVEEDSDVYMPALCSMAAQASCELERDCASCDMGSDELRIAFKFRKNYFSKEEQDQAYIGLREAATETQNRGLASGPRAEKLGNREWVTSYQYDIIDYFLKPSENVFGDDQIQVIKDKYKVKDNSPSNRSHVWSIDRVKKEKFVFDDWVEATAKLSKDEQILTAKHIAERLICQTTYANSVNSGIAGWFDRYPRIPYGRTTSYTRDNREKFEMAYPFLQTLARGFKNFFPWRYKNQMDAAAKMDPSFMVPETPFTTITVNKTFRTAAHYDAGDLNSGLSNLLVLSNNGNYSGGYLVAPEYRVAVNVRPGDLLLINNHEVMHGNTPIILNDPEAERISLVCYFREKMLELGSKEYEECRFNFVESRRLNKEHKDWRPLWNGISPGQWESKEWKEYLVANGGMEMAKTYEPKLMEEVATLEGFF